jgi:hypothetical protein
MLGQDIAQVQRLLGWRGLQPKLPSDQPNLIGERAESPRVMIGHPCQGPLVKQLKPQKPASKAADKHALGEGDGRAELAEHRARSATKNGLRAICRRSCRRANRA